MSTANGGDPIAVLVKFAGHLAGPLRIGTEAMIRGDGPLAPEDEAYLQEVLQATLDADPVTPDRREQLEGLILEAKRSSPVLRRLPVPAPQAPPPPPPVGTVPSRPTRAGDSASTPSDRPRLRRWLRIAGATAVLAALGGLGWLSWANYQTGEQWRAQAAAAVADVEALSQENAVVESDLEDVQAALKRSEADVGLLEERVARAADSKARAEDERELATAMVERIAEVAGAYDAVAEQFRWCMAEQATLTSMVVDIELYLSSQQGYLVTNQIDRTQGVCSDADTQLADLRAYVNALMAP